MKYAVCNEMFVSWSFERICDFIAEHGYQGVEIAPFTFAEDAGQITKERRKRLRQVAENAGIEIIGLHWLLARTEGYHLTSPDPEVHQKTAGYFKVLIELCADFGGKYMVLGSPKQRNLLPGVTKDHAAGIACDLLQQLVPALKEHGVTITVEPLAPSETDFLTTAGETVELLEKIGAPGQVALHLDCKAMTSERESIPDLIKKHQKWMRTFHANDPNLQGPGFGDLDFRPIMAALRETDYQGWISVETFDYSPGPERLAVESINHMKNCSHA